MFYLEITYKDGRISYRTYKSYAEADAERDRISARPNVAKAYVAEQLRIYI